MTVILILIDSFEDFGRDADVVKHFSMRFNLKKKKLRVVCLVVVSRKNFQQFACQGVLCASQGVAHEVAKQEHL